MAAWLGWQAQAQLVTNVVNDGTTADNLTRIANREGTWGAEVSLTFDPVENALLAEQTPDVPDIPVRTAWYPTDQLLTNPVYRVYARVKPSGPWPECRVGVIGWLDPETSQGLVFQIWPGGAAASFQFATVNFLAATTEENENLSHLYLPNGTPASAQFGSGWLELGTYDPADWATLVLDFAAPSTKDRDLIPGVTAHVTATVTQGIDVRYNPMEVAKLQLLTDLPAPTNHAYGYFAVWGNVNVPGGQIGYLGGLTVIRPAGGLVAAPPVRITHPTAGARFAAGCNVRLTAEVTRPANTVARVEFYVDGTLVGSTSQFPPELTTQVTSTGTHLVSARAIDGSGGAATSDPVAIEVQALTLSAPQPFPSAQQFDRLQFTVAGVAGTSFGIEVSSDLRSWQPVGSGVATEAPLALTVPADRSLAHQFFRLVVQE